MIERYYVYKFACVVTVVLIARTLFTSEDKGGNRKFPKIIHNQKCFL